MQALQWFQIICYLWNMKGHDNMSMNCWLKIAAIFDYYTYKLNILTATGDDTTSIVWGREGRVVRGRGSSGEVR